MTKEITKAYILQEMQDKLKLREFESTPFLFNETVVPVYNIEPHLRTAVGKTATKSITATGGYAFHFPPQNEKWLVNGYTIIFMASGAYTVAGAYVTRSKSGSSQNIYLDLTAAQSTSYTVNLPKPLILYPDDSIRINVDGYTSTANLMMDIDCEVEVLR